MSLTERYADGADVRRLQPLRVLLAGTDRRFNRVTSFLLSRRGYDVAQATPPDTLAAAERHRSDVVLLDRGDSRVSTGRKVAALQALSIAPSIIVIVENEDDEQWNGVSAIRKWSPVDELVDAIETAALTRPTPFAAGEASQL
jgi:CheY-like chemotaxis protein